MARQHLEGSDTRISSVVNILWYSETFERVVQYCDARLSYIPLNFMLGFFVTAVVNRWTYLYQIIGFIDNIGLMTAEYVRGRTELARMYRRNIVRYCELAQVLVFRDISMRTRRRFPTLDTVVAAGFMMPHEKERFDEIQYRYSKYWVPFQWALALTYDARKRGLIESDYYQVVVQEEIKKFRTGLAWICNYDWVPIPIMYPQLVCLAVHTYFLVCLLARQYIVSEHANNKTEVDLYFPIMSTLQFIFYMGWMKVAEAMLNPFGEDDDDFECNALIDRNITMVLMMVDQGYDRPPELQKDTFWDEEVEPLYSEETARIPNNPLKGSVSEVKLPESVHQIKMIPHFDDRDPLLSNSPSLRRRVSVVPVRQLNYFIISDFSPHALFALTLYFRSLSRGQLHEGVPRKTVSHGNLETLDINLNTKRPSLHSGDSTPKKEKSFSNGAFVETQDEISNAFSQPIPSDKGLKEVRKTSSSTNIKAQHDFPHHVLDDVLEENEEEVGSKVIRKRSVFEPRLAECERHPATVKERESRETQQNEGAPNNEEEKKRENTRSSEFFIGNADNDDHH
uniref:Bestrophin homolog n=1 Tax=Heterorhabditis bacteriophora TaxID=37862 RepID=A0A1I7XR67_HETBA